MFINHETISNIKKEIEQVISENNIFYQRFIHHNFLANNNISISDLFLQNEIVEVAVKERISFSLSSILLDVDKFISSDDWEDFLKYYYKKYQEEKEDNEMRHKLGKEINFYCFIEEKRLKYIVDLMKRIIQNQLKKQ